LLIDAGVAAGDDFPFARDDGEPPLAETRLHLVVAQDLAIELIVAGTAQTQDRVLRAQQHHGVDVAAGDVAPAAGGGDLAHLWLRRPLWGLGEALRDHQAAVSLDVSHQNPPVCMRPRTAPKPTSSVAPPARGAVGSRSAGRPARRTPVDCDSIGTGSISATAYWSMARAIAESPWRSRPSEPRTRTPSGTRMMPLILRRHRRSAMMSASRGSVMVRSSIAATTRGMCWRYHSGLNFTSAMRVAPYCCMATSASQAPLPVASIAPAAKRGSRSTT